MMSYESENISQDIVSGSSELTFLRKNLQNFMAKMDKH